MGSGVSCYSSSFNAGYNGCNSYPNNSVLNAGAIVGIVLGSLLAIAIIVFLLVFSYKLYKRNNSPLHQSHRPNVYSLPMNMNNDHQSARRSEMYIPSKPPIYSEAPIHNGLYENA
jgi:hypothetical protein